MNVYFIHMLMFSGFHFSQITPAKFWDQGLVIVYNKTPDINKRYLFHI